MRLRSPVTAATGKPPVAFVASQAACEAALRSNPQVLARVREVAEELRAEAVALARVRAFESGKYMAGIVVIELPGGRWAVVATAPHSWFVEEGTGIYGPRRRPVLASEVTHGGYFRFMVADAGAQRLVFTDQQRGRPARHVMGDAALNIARVPGVTFRLIAA